MRCGAAPTVSLWLHGLPVGQIRREKEKMQGAECLAQKGEQYRADAAAWHHALPAITNRNFCESKREI